MSVGLLIITHERLAQDLIQTARTMLGDDPLEMAAVHVPYEADPDRMLEKAGTACQRLDQGDGVLVLTDIYGSTPSNIACQLRRHTRVQVVAGVNLPMLIRVLNYPGLDLEGLVDKALSGGRDGILVCRPRPGA